MRLELEQHLSGRFASQQGTPWGEHVTGRVQVTRGPSLMSEAVAQLGHGRDRPSQGAERAPLVLRPEPHVLPQHPEDSTGVEAWVRAEGDPLFYM